MITIRAAVKDVLSKIEIGEVKPVCLLDGETPIGLLPDVSAVVGRELKRKAVMDAARHAIRNGLNVEQFDYFGDTAYRLSKAA